MFLLKADTFLWKNYIHDMELLNKAKWVYQTSKEYANLSCFRNISMGKWAWTDNKNVIGNDQNIVFYLIP